MKIVVDRKELKNNLQILKKCVDSTNESCKLEVFDDKKSDNQLVLTTINNVIDISVKLTMIAIYYDEPFACLVDVPDFYEIVRKFKSDEVHIDRVSDFMLNISCGDMQEKIAYSIPNGKSSNYSLELDEKTEQLDDKKSFDIDSDKLIDLIKRTTYASQSKNTDSFWNTISSNLYILKCIKFEIFKKYIKTVALDGYRLSMQLDHINGCVPEHFDMLILSDYLNTLSKALPKKYLIKVNVTKDGWVYFHWNSRMNIFKFQLCNDDYFKYQKIVPECDKFTTTIKVNRKQLLNAVKESKTYKKTYQCDHILDILDIHDNKLRLTYRGNHKLLGTKDIDILQYGNDIEIAFNPKFLEEALKANPKEFVKIKLISELDPIIIMDCSRDNIGLILPVRFRNCDY